MTEHRNAHRLQWLIEGRHSSRGPYDPARRVTDGELAMIVDAARWAPIAHDLQNFHLVAVDDPAVLAALGDLRAEVSSPACRTDDPSVLAGEVRPLAHVIGGAPLVIVVLADPTRRARAPEGDVLGQIGLGCVLENVWLVAHALGLALQVTSTFAADRVEPEVRRVLGVPPPWRIAYALRLGHAIDRERPLRVRRDVETFVHRNRF